MKTARARNLSILAYAQGFTFWLYKINPLEETINDTEEPDFFSDLDMLSTNDVVLITGAGNAKLRTIGFAGETKPLAD